MTTKRTTFGRANTGLAIAVVVIATVSACTASKKSAQPAAPTTIAAGRPGAPAGPDDPAAAISKTIPPPGNAEVVVGEDPERLDGVTNLDEIGDAFDANISPIAVRDPNATDEDVLPPIPLPPPGPDGKIPTTIAFPRNVQITPLPPLGTSLSEREAKEIPTTSRVGSLDNDASVAAPDTRIPVLNTLPTVTTVLVTTTTAKPLPDLGLDPAAAERIMARVAWPSALVVQPGAEVGGAGNALASIFAEDRALRRALRSSSSRLLIETESTGVAVYVGGIVEIDPSALGPSVTDEMVRSLAAEGAARVSTFDGLPCVIVERTDGIREYAVVVKNRIVAAGSGVRSDANLRLVVQALIKAAGQP